MIEALESRRYLRGMATSIALAVAGSLKEMLFLPLLSKNLGPAEYGLWAMVRTVIQLLLSLSLLGMDTGMLRFWPSLAGDPRRFRSAAAGALVAGTASATVVAALAVALAWGVLPAALRALALASALLLWGTAGRQWFVAHFRATSALGTLALLILCEAGAELAAVAVTLAAGGRVAEVVGALALVRGGTLVAALLAFGRTTGWGPPRLDRVRELVQFGAPTVPVAACVWLLNLSDRYLVAYFLGTEAVGIYAAAYGIGSVVTLVFGPFFFNLGVVTAGRWDRGDRVGAIRLVGSAQRYGLLVAIPCCALLGVVSRDVVRLLATERFLAGAGLILLIALAYVLFNVSVYFEVIIGLLRRTRTLPVVYGLPAAANITLNLVLLPRYGIRAAAVTTLLSFGIMAALSQWVVAREVRVWPVWREMAPALAKCLAASGAAAYAVARWIPPGTARVFGGVAGGFALYTGLMFALGGLSWAEVRTLATHVHPRGGGEVIG